MSAFGLATRYRYSHKSSPNILVTFWAIFNNVTIMVKVCSYFLGNFRGKLFIPSSGHTGSDTLFTRSIPDTFTDDFFSRKWDRLNEICHLCPSKEIKII